MIRRATVADAAVIARIQVAGWEATYRALMPADAFEAMTVPIRTARWKSLLAERGTVTWLHGEPAIGFASVGPSREPEAHGELHLYALYLEPAHIGTGVGRALMEHVMQGAREMTLFVLDGNARAIRFYEAAGFVYEGKKDDPFGVHLRYRYIASPPSTSIVRPLK